MCKMKDIELNKILSDRISFLRKEYNLTIEKLAYQSGISKGGLSEIENCKKEPKIKTIAKICAGLGITLDKFYNFKEIKEYVEKL